MGCSRIRSEPPTAGLSAGLSCGIAFEVEVGLFTLRLCIDLVSGWVYVGDFSEKVGHPEIQYVGCHEWI